MQRMYRLKHFLAMASNSHWYWLLYIVGSLGMIAVALGHQYVLGDPPCPLCIHVRLYVSALFIVSIIAYCNMSRWRVRLVSHMMVVAIAVGLFERSYQLLGTERGFLLSDCGIDSGLPIWLGVDRLLPWLYGVKTTCGYTPELLFGVTMAEALILFSSGLFLLGTTMLIFYILDRPKEG